MGDFKMNDTWLGIGAKTGGFLVCGGVESTVGPIFKLSNTAFRLQFSLTSIRFGLGVGGGTGLVAMCVFNCPHIARLDNMMNYDWGVNLSLGAKWDDVAKTLRNYRFFAAVAAIGTKLAFNPKAIEDIRNVMHYLYNIYDMGTMDNTPTVIAFDTPVGTGVEASINWCVGRIHIDG